MTHHHAVQTFHLLLEEGLRTMYGGVSLRRGGREKQEGKTIEIYFQECFGLRNLSSDRRQEASRTPDDECRKSCLSSTKQRSDYPAHAVDADKITLTQRERERKT